MAKSYTTYTAIRGKEPMLRRILCEVRYSDGQLYLDRTGRLLKRLLADAPEWMFAPTPTPQGTSLYNVKAATNLGFGINSASLTLDKSSSDELIRQEEMQEFLREIDDVLGLVLDELEV